jgi:molecular chaperone Hsp33
MLRIASAEQIVRQVSGEHDCRLFGPTAVQFGCRCSTQRVADVIRSLGLAEAQATLAEQGLISVTCEFCARRYQFDAIDVEQLFASGAALQPGPDSVN